MEFQSPFFRVVIQTAWSRMPTYIGSVPRPPRLVVRAHPGEISEGESVHNSILGANWLHFNSTWWNLGHCSENTNLVFISTLPEKTFLEFFAKGVTSVLKLPIINGLLH